MTRPGFITRATTALVALLMIILGGQSAFAQSVSNTARATWSFGNRVNTATSNAVTVTVTEPRPIKIGTFVNGSASGQATNYTPAMCGGAIMGASSNAQSAVIKPSTTLRSGETFYVRVDHPDANAHPDQVDQLDLVLTTNGGDRETVTVFETAPNSGIFTGALATTKLGPQVTQNNCKLAVNTGDKVLISVMQPGSSSPAVQTSVDVLADPFGWVFDSVDGTPIDGAKVTLVDAQTGAPVDVYAPDGVTRWPSTVFTGQLVTDAAGNEFQLLPGQYQFPLAATGTYKVIVVPPTPYRVPSIVTPAELANVTRPGGESVIILPASYGDSFVLTGEGPIQIDVPADTPQAGVFLTKSVSRQRVQPGDVVFYTVTARNPDARRVKRAVSLVDLPSPLLRLRPETVRIDGEAALPSVLTITPDGREMRFDFGTIAPGAVKTITYAMTVRPDAPPGQAINQVEATDWQGVKSVASAVIDIESNNLISRMTIIGRITDSGCGISNSHRGIPGVQVLLEDGSYAITDADGRYHFDGVVPGTHVVAISEPTLPKGGKLLNCGLSTREAGSASSRFVRGRGGSLAVANFHASLPEGWAEAAGLTAGPDAKPIQRTVQSLEPGKAATVIDEATYGDRMAAGAETDWLAIGDGPPAFLFPSIDHNPRAPAVRVVVRHKPDQKVSLSVGGKAVDAVSFDGTKRSADGNWSVSIWRAIPLEDGVTHLTAQVLAADGSTVTELTRDVHFATTAAQVEFIPEKSQLIADGKSRPVVAVRITNRDGRPLHNGISGEFALNAPYESAASLDQLQNRALTGQGRSAPRWTVNSDDGIAYIELAPTMVSGALQLDFDFIDKQQRRRQTVNGWIVPGDVKWTLVGLAEGTVGARSVADEMQRADRFDSDLGKNARTAFYAKGRVLGKHLLTLAYDSAKQKLDTQLLGTIDPRAYYTVFADGSDRRFDAASRSKLYVRVDSRSFNGMFGDFETGFNQTQLTRYNRTGTGVRGELRIGGLHAEGFATRIASASRRDEIQGAGISGPYRLSSRAILANSEVIVLEVRDRLRSEKVVETRTLTRFVDYTVDLLSGTVTFKQPVLSRDNALNPQIIVITYEVDTNMASGEMNAGVRADLTTSKGNLRLGVTAVTDTGTGTRTEMGGVDLKAKLGPNSELRAEVAASRSAQTGTRTAWLVEAEHHDRKLDLLAYARSMDRGYGVGQSSGAESGRRKYGVDARILISDAFSVTASGWIDDDVTEPTQRKAVQVKAEYRTQNTTVRAGVSRLDDRLAEGSRYTSTVIEGGVSQRLLDNQLELDASTSVSIGSADSIDLPTRHQFTARYAVTQNAKLVGSYEIASGSAVSARTARAGIELTPWRGSRVTGGIGQQNVTEYGKRSFASFGLAQTLDLTKHLTVDATLESSKTLGRFDTSRIVNPAQPVASGGQLGIDGTLTEDFTAITAGATWRADRWTVTARGEWRDGEFEQRKGATFGAIRQLGEGSMVGSGFTWTNAKATDGSSSTIWNGAVALAHRPDRSSFATLAKIELRSDKVTAATGGIATSVGGTAFTGTGNLLSTRIIGSVSTNWSPMQRRSIDDNKQNDTFMQRTEIGLFGAVRYNLDRGGNLELRGTSLFGGLDARIGIGKRLEIGGTVTLRTNLSDHVTSFAGGPEIGFVPARDMLLSVGYNFTGFRDRDFSAARSTEKGVYAALRMKFDSSTLGILGLKD
jgi:uncharacterized repeat protein (TIGR01451 family)